MLLYSALVLLGLSTTSLGIHATSRRTKTEQDTRNIAIIGAGAAGASAAYYLQRFAESADIPVNVTIFEKTQRIGGRTLTVNTYDDPSQPVELGASIFITLNHIIYGAAQRFNLPFEDLQPINPHELTAIWDGENLVFETVASSSWWWEAARMWWRYGTSPYRAVSLVKNVVNIFLKLYEPPYFPFRSLTQRVYELGLERATGVTGEQFLEDNKIGTKFSREIIQAATRVNYASNLAHIHGLETMVSFATEGAVAIDGGNWQIFDKMVQQSGANLLRNVTVESIALEKRRTSSSRSHAKYIVSTKDNEVAVASFDDVIIATPWQFSNISAGVGVMRQHIDAVPYTKLHVTLFTSASKLNGEFFGLASGSKVPSNVYTTLSPNEIARQGSDGVGKAGFYSISTLRTVTNPETQEDEYLYKIFSAEAVTAEFLSQILGIAVPTEIITPKSEDGTKQPVSWYYPHWFHSYPVELPRVTFQDPVLGEGLYYTSGIESFISTMETSALMGKNVARLIIDDAIGPPAQEVRNFMQANHRRPRPSREDFFDSMESELEAMMMMGPDEL